MTKQEILAALTAAMAAPVTPSRGYGCGRAYVCISADRPTVTAFAAAAKRLGLLFMRKAYGTGGNALYIGYDNSDGKALAKSRAVAASLKASGLNCYAEAVGD